MATFYSNLYTEAAADNGSYGYNGPLGTNAHQVVGVNGYAAVPGEITSSDTISLFTLPKGARIVSWVHWWEDLGATMTMTVQNNTTDMKASIAGGTAQAITSATALSTAELVAGWDESTSAASTPNITFTTATTPTAGAKYYFVAQYVMPSV